MAYGRWFTKGLIAAMAAALVQSGAILLRLDSVQAVGVVAVAVFVATCFLVWEEVRHKRV
jgi:putative N-acetylmannosamine-6-phosphate epimerase